MYPQRDSITSTISWSAGSTESLDLNLTGYITQIDVYATLTVTKGTSPSTGLDTDAAMRAFDTIKVTASNWKDWISFSDGRQAFWASYLKSQGNAICEGLTETASDTDTVTVQFSIHPGSNFGNTKDLSRVIPFRGFSNVQFKVGWAAAGAIATGYTITGGTVEIVVHRMVLDKGESEKEAFAGTDYLLLPRYIPQQYSITDTVSNYSFIKNIPTGSYIRDLLMMVADSNDKRSNTDVTEVQVADNKGNTRFKESRFARFVRTMRQNFYLPTTPTGVAMVMFKEITTKDYGLDMTAASLGDWKMEMSTGAANGKVFALYEGMDMLDIDPTEVGQ